jgi:hypothetical protein
MFYYSVSLITTQERSDVIAAGMVFRGHGSDQTAQQNLEEENDPDFPPPPNDEDDIDIDNCSLRDQLSDYISSSDNSSLPPSEPNSDDLASRMSRLTTPFDGKDQYRYHSHSNSDRGSDEEAYHQRRKKPRQHLTADRLIVSAGSVAIDDTTATDQGTSTQRGTRKPKVFYGRKKRSYNKKNITDDI